MSPPDEFDRSLERRLYDLITHKRLVEIVGEDPPWVIDILPWEMKAKILGWAFPHLNRVNLIEYPCDH